MRRMTDGYGTVRVREWIILSNAWEYYVIDSEIDLERPSIVLAVVCGFETEIGYVCLEEIEPYIRSRTKNLSSLLPADGWRWVK